jgi:hypothetical protein
MVLRNDPCLCQASILGTLDRQRGWLLNVLFPLLDEHKVGGFRKGGRTLVKPQRVAVTMKWLVDLVTHWCCCHVQGFKQTRITYARNLGETHIGMNVPFREPMSMAAMARYEN